MNVLRNYSYTSKVEDIKRFADLTFYSYLCKNKSKPPNNVGDITEAFLKAITFLFDHKFIIKHVEPPKEENTQDSFKESQSRESQLDNSQISQSTRDSQLDNSQFSTDTQQTEKEPEEDEKPPQWDPTPFGEATFKSSFSMDEAAFVSQQLLRCQENGLVLIDELHLCYLVTPVGIPDEPNWMVCEFQFCHLPNRCCGMNSIGYLQADKKLFNLLDFRKTS